MKALERAAEISHACTWGMGPTGPPGFLQSSNPLWAELGVVRGGAGVVPGWEQHCRSGARSGSQPARFSVSLPISSAAGREEFLHIHRWVCYRLHHLEMELQKPPELGFESQAAQVDVTAGPHLHRASPCKDKIPLTPSCPALQSFRGLWVLWCPRGQGKGATQSSIKDKGAKLGFLNPNSSSLLL